MAQLEVKIVIAPDSRRVLRDLVRAASALELLAADMPWNAELKRTARLLRRAARGLQLVPQ